MSGHFYDDKFFFSGDDPRTVLSDNFFQTRIQITYRNLIQGNLLEYYLIIQIIKSLDHINDFFNLPCKLDYLFFRCSYLYGNPVDTLLPAFRCGKTVYVYPPPGKNKGDPTQNPYKIFSENRNGVSFHVL